MDVIHCGVFVIGGSLLCVRLRKTTKLLAWQVDGYTSVTCVRWVFLLLRVCGVLAHAGEGACACAGGWVCAYALVMAHCAVICLFADVSWLFLLHSSNAAGMLLLVMNMVKVSAPWQLSICIA